MKEHKLLVFILFCNFQLNSECFSQINIDSTTQKDVITAWVPVNKVIFPIVDIEAEYSKGKKEWNKFIESNLNMQVPIANGAPKGIYTVSIKFIVSIEGSLRDFKAETNIGYGMEDEAIRLIKLSSLWKPAKVDKREVNSIKRQDISFLIE